MVNDTPELAAHSVSLRPGQVSDFLDGVRELKADIGAQVGKAAQIFGLVHGPEIEASSYASSTRLAITAPRIARATLAWAGGMVTAAPLAARSPGMACPRPHDATSGGERYSASVSPEPPKASGKSLSLGRPSFIGGTVSA